MKYKAKSELCSKGCGRKRVDNQRYCRKCRALAQKEYRAKSAKPGALLDRAVKQIKASSRKVDPVFLRKLEEMAAQVKRQIDQFNGDIERVA